MKNLPITKSDNQRIYPRERVILKGIQDYIQAIKGTEDTPIKCELRSILITKFEGRNQIAITYTQSHSPAIINPMALVTSAGLENPNPCLLDLNWGDEYIVKIQSAPYGPGNEFHSTIIQVTF